MGKNGFGHANEFGSTKPGWEQKSGFFLACIFESGFGVFRRAMFGSIMGGPCIVCACICISAVSARTTAGVGMWYDSFFVMGGRWFGLFPPMIRFPIRDSACLV